MTPRISRVQCLLNPISYKTWHHRFHGFTGWIKKFIKRSSRAKSPTKPPNHQKPVSKDASHLGGTIGSGPALLSAKSVDFGFYPELPAFPDMLPLEEDVRSFWAMLDIPQKYMLKNKDATEGFF